MSITTETNRLAFVGDGSDNSPYAISFPLRDANSVEMFFTTDATGAEASKTEGVDYTIALAADFVTANLTLLTTAPATGETMVIIRNEPATRLSNYSNFDGFPSGTLNSDYDKGTMQDLTLQEQLDRAVVVSKGHPNASLPLTPLTLKGNAGKTIVVNSGETDFELLLDSIADGTITPAKLLDGSVDNQVIQYNDGLGEWEYRVNLTVPGTLASGAHIVTGNISASGNITSTGEAMGVTGSSVGIAIQLVVQNADFSDLGSDAQIRLQTEDSTGGDPYIEWQIGLVAQSYVMGIDNSDSDKFVGSVGGALGTANWLEVTIAGAVTLANALATGALAVTGAIVTTTTITAGSGSTILTTAAGLLRHQAIDPAIAGSGLSVASGVLSTDLAGSGSTNTLTKWTGASTVGDSQIVDDGSNVGIGAGPSSIWHVQAAGGVTSQLEARSDANVIQTLQNTVKAWWIRNLATSGNFVIRNNSDTIDAIIIVPTGDVTLASDLDVTGDLVMSAGQASIGVGSPSTNTLNVISVTTANRAAEFSRNINAAIRPVVRILQDNLSGAQPCLELDQDDVSEGFIDFVGSDQGVIGEGVSSVESLYVELNGTVRRLALYAV